jgi:hypothetical protein
MLFMKPTYDFHPGSYANCVPSATPSIVRIRELWNKAVLISCCVIPTPRVLWYCMLRPIGCNLLPMVDTVANRQEVCEAWCVTPCVASGEDCIGMLTGLSLYGAVDVDDVVLFMLVYVTPCSSDGG